VYTKYWGRGRKDGLPQPKVMNNYVYYGMWDVINDRRISIHGISYIAWRIGIWATGKAYVLGQDKHNRYSSEIIVDY